MDGMKEQGHGSGRTGDGEDDVVAVVVAVEEQEEYNTSCYSIRGRSFRRLLFLFQLNKTKSSKEEKQAAAAGREREALRAALKAAAEEAIKDLEELAKVFDHVADVFFYCSCIACFVFVLVYSLQ